MSSLEEIHLNSHIHRIVEILKKEDRKYSIKELNVLLNINILRNARLVDALKKNPRIVFENGTLRFQPVFNIRNVDDLENVLLKFNYKEGIEKAKLVESPINVHQFIDELKNKGKIIILQDMDGSDIVFYNDMKIIPADEIIRSMWKDIKVPDYHDVLDELNSVGLDNSGVQALKKKRAVKKKAAKRSQRRIKMTNTHVKELDLQNINESD